jgi:hypothetical protein
MRLKTNESKKNLWFEDSTPLLLYFKKRKVNKKNTSKELNSNYSRIMTFALLLFFVLQTALFAIGELGVGYPIFKFLFLGYGKFGDFVDGLVLTPAYFSSLLADMETFSQPQGPPVLVFYDFWRSITPDLAVTDSNLIKIYQVFLILILLALIFLWVLNKISNSIKYSIFLIFTYPFLFLFGRGNPDLICVILLGLAIWALQKSRFTSSAVLIGLMGAFKIPYLALAILFIPARRVKMLIYTSLSFVFFFFGSLLTRPYGMLEQLKTFQIITERYFRDYALGDGGHLFNTSVFGLTKTLGYLLTKQDFKTIEQLLDFNSALLILYYGIVVLILVAIGFYYSWHAGALTLPNEKLLPEVLFAATLILIALPQVSADYRLALLLPPLAWMIGSNSKLISPKLLIISSILFLPKHFIQFDHNDLLRGTSTLNSIANPIILLIMLFQTLKFLGIESKKAKVGREH